MIGGGVTDAPVEVSAPFATALVRLAERRSEIVALSADLAKYTDVAPFAERFPERFFQVGMAEQNMMGIAGGLARMGFVPFVATYGVFASRRAYDQVAMALALGRANVKLIAFLPGLTSSGGPTHQAIEDLATMRALPNMVVIDPVDAVEVEQAVEVIAAHPGPVYMRGLRGTVPIVLDRADYRFEIGKARVLRDGSDLTIVGTGIMTRDALHAAAMLARHGIHTAVVHASTLKPFDHEPVVRLARESGAILTVENHSVVGGLASAVDDVLACAGISARVAHLGLQDVFAEAGSPEYLFEKYGLTASGIARAARALLSVERRA